MNKKTKKNIRKSQSKAWTAGLIGIIIAGTAMIATSATAGADKIDPIKETKKTLEMGEKMGMTTLCESIDIALMDPSDEEKGTAYGYFDPDPDGNGTIDECWIRLDEEAHAGNQKELMDTIIHETTHAFTIGEEHDYAWKKAYRALSAARGHEPMSQELYE